MSIEYGLVFTFFSAQFDIPYSILFQVTLSHFSKVKIIVGMPLPSFADNFFVPKKNKKKIFNSKVAWHQSCHILCPSFVCKLPRECEDITKNAWRTPLNAQCNIEYRLHYSLLF